MDHIKDSLWTAEVTSLSLPIGRLSSPEPVFQVTIFKDNTFPLFLRLSEKYLLHGKQNTALFVTAPYLSIYLYSVVFS
jgi:hypothetical protein